MEILAKKSFKSVLYKNNALLVAMHTLKTTFGM
jgi:hypothetical protein